MYLVIKLFNIKLFGFSGEVVWVWRLCSSVFAQANLLIPLFSPNKAATSRAQNGAKAGSAKSAVPWMDTWDYLQKLANKTWR